MDIYLFLNIAARNTSDKSSHIYSMNLRFMIVLDYKYSCILVSVYS